MSGVTRRRSPRQPAPAGPVGETVELDVGPVAHGGACVARLDGRVVFVRHALPGERVLARLTETARRGYWRADAVEVLRPSADRVEPPCPHAGPARCGGCDWQHVSPAAQRRLKAAVVAEQFARLAAMTVDVPVEELPGGPLGWRTRVRYAVDPAGAVGFREHRSHRVHPVDRCLIATDAVTATGVTEHRFPGATDVVVAASSTTPTAAAVVEPDGDAATVTELAAGRAFTLPPDVFWQVHPAAPATLTEAVLTALEPREGETALDLYAGAGLFTAALADGVGTDGRVVAVEVDGRAVGAAAAALADSPQVSLRPTSVSVGLLTHLPERPDVVVLDPPRAGAGTEVIAALLAHRPRAVAYVSCDPATLARDVAAAAAAGYRLAGLRAFDMFPMTAHVECLALLTP